MNQGVLPPGTVLGKYRVLRLIGEGGMGAAYEAEHVDLGKPVALKTLLAGLGSNREAQVRFPTEAGLGTDPEFARRQRNRLRTGKPRA